MMFLLRHYRFFFFFSSYSHFVCLVSLLRFFFVVHFVCFVSVGHSFSRILELWASLFLKVCRENTINVCQCVCVCVRCRYTYLRCACNNGQTQITKQMNEWKCDASKKERDREKAREIEGKSRSSSGPEKKHWMQHHPTHCMHCERVGTTDRDRTFRWYSVLFIHIISLLYHNFRIYTTHAHLGLVFRCRCYCCWCCRCCCSCFSSVVGRSLL